MKSATSARDCEAETRQVALARAIFPRVRLVCKFRWTHDGPIESAFAKDPFHRGCIGNRAREKQPAEKDAGGRMESLNRKATLLKCTLNTEDSKKKRRVG